VAIYREQALYLQVLRDLLQSATRQALFNLLGEVDPSRFSRLPDQARQNFHQVIDQLTKRCSVLLTVEQLILLVNQMQQEQRRRQAHASRVMLQNLTQQVNTAEVASSDPEPVREEPSGSIQLSLTSPLEQAPAPADAPAASDQGTANGDLDMLRSLFELAGDAMQQGPVDEPSVGATAGSTLSQDQLMPNQPDALLHWLHAMDQAVERRLRNLSHAVNVQMLRSGLAQALLPINLLESVLNGQVETLPTATNVLRLRLPLAVGELDQGMDVLCVLLRCSDLEFDSLRLRHCRKRLRAHQQELLTMVRQQRHWQRRSLDREARTHWQTPSDSTTPASGD